MTAVQDGFKAKLYTSATVPEVHGLFGGLYQVNAVSASWGGGSVALYTLGPDGVTWLQASIAITQNGGAQYYLAPGQYQIQVTGSPTVTAFVARIPTE